jgi:putative transposase
MTTSLTKSKSVIGIEDLNVSGMMKNHCLAQAISDLGLHEFRRQLGYKGKLYGCQIVVVDRFFPSSKMCNVCGCLNGNLELSDRSWSCDCGAKHDRDMNAATNLKNYAEKAVVSSTKALNAYGGALPLLPSQDGNK